MKNKLPWLLEYFLEDVLEWNASFKSKKMFWWYWVWKNWKFFAIYGYYQIYFKVWENNIDDYNKYWSKQFTYEKNNKTCY